MDGRPGHQIRQWTVTDYDGSQSGQRSKSEAPDGEVPPLKARTSTFRTTSANVRLPLVGARETRAPTSVALGRRRLRSGRTRLCPCFLDGRIVVGHRSLHACHLRVMTSPRVGVSLGEGEQVICRVPCRCGLASRTASGRARAPYCRLRFTQEPAA
jgi:hypothetical protein